MEYVVVRFLMSFDTKWVIPKKWFDEIGLNYDLTMEDNEKISAVMPKNMYDDGWNITDMSGSLLATSEL